MIDVEVLRLALSKEEDAIKMYEEMIRTNPGVRDVLYALMGEEQKHKKLIEKKILDMTRY